MERRWTEQICHQGSGSCKIETLNTEVYKLGLDLMITKEKEGSSAASTAAASLGYGGSIGGGKRNVQAGFSPSWLELKGWEIGGKVLGTAIDANGVSDLVSRVKANMLWMCKVVSIEHEQRNYELKMMVFLWFKLDVRIWDQKCSLADRPLAVREYNVRVILEISPEKRSWSKAQATFLGAMVLCATRLTSSG